MINSHICCREPEIKVVTDMGFGAYGGGCGVGYGGGGFALIVVLFILLIIVGAAYVW
jgi:uncharacterized protein (TIGR01732 family)